MPKNYFGGEGGKMTTNLDVITGFGALGILEQNEKLANQVKQ